MVGATKSQNRQQRKPHKMPISVFGRECEQLGDERDAPPFEQKRVGGLTRDDGLDELQVLDRVVWGSGGRSHSMSNLTWRKHVST